MAPELLPLTLLLQEHGADFEAAVERVGAEALRCANQDARAALARLSTASGPPDFEALNRLDEEMMSRANQREAAVCEVSLTLGLAAGLAMARCPPEQRAATGRAAVRAALAVLREPLGPEPARQALAAAGIAVRAQV